MSRQQRSGPAGHSLDTIDVLIAIAAPRARSGAGQLRAVIDRYLEEPDDPTHDDLLSGRVRARVDTLTEGGWQPHELAFVVEQRAARVAGLLSAVLVDHGRRHDRGEAMPAAWRSQLEQLVPRAAELTAGEPMHAALLAGGRDRLDLWADLLTLAAVLAELPALERLMAPPSRWAAADWRPPGAGSRAGSSNTPRSGDRHKMLDRIRALLATAESTEFAQEAEVFTAKAQDLMTRHAVDQAFLTAGGASSIDVSASRVLVDSPYAEEKTYLLNAVAAANRCRMVWFAQVSLATVVGTPVDVDQVEMLFTSLLIQATRAMAEAGSVRAGSWDRTPTYRRSFLAAYGVRIGERLAEANQSATASYGTDLVPVLQQQREAVDEAFGALFPRTVSKSSGSRYVASGWNAGREAADRARLARGRITDG